MSEELSSGRGEKSSPENEGGESTALLRPVPAVRGQYRTSLLDAPAPAIPIAKLEPAQLEPYILAGIHQDRSPGNVLVVLHPGKRYKIPDGLLDALGHQGFRVVVHETLADTMASIRSIRDRLLALHRENLPLDVIVVGGDGTLDHHFLIAAYAAFYPDRVQEVPGRVDCSAVTMEQRRKIPEPLRTAFRLEEPLPPVPPTTENIQSIWLLRARLERLLEKRATVPRILRSTGRDLGDPLLRTALLATFFPAEAALLPDHFDLEGLAQATQQETFRGLYPFIRAIVPYPAGTAADNAVFAGVPGWGYGMCAKLFRRLPCLSFLARRMGGRARRRFLRYFTSQGIVVPARVSLARVDGHWQRLGSHALGGPASGRFFSRDLTHKASTITGYLLRAPLVVLGEAFGRTVVEVESFSADGARKSFVRGRLAEGLYTNRTFIGGVGAVPTTTPTSFGGESSLIVLSPLLFLDESGKRMELNLRGLLTFLEAIGKGVLARGLHLLGLNPGKLAGEGKMVALQTEYQVAIQEGEEIRIRYHRPDGSPKAVPAQVSGDPFQATELGVKVMWGPIPLLAARRSLLLESTQRTLAHLRLQQSYRLSRAYIGGVHHFRHTTGIRDPVLASNITGLIPPPLWLPTNLRQAQQQLLREWQKLGTGEFVDTSAPGLALLRRGLFCHNNDQTAHLLLLKDGWTGLLVRQVRRFGPGGVDVYESRTRYGWQAGSYVIHQSQTMHHTPEGPPRLIIEDHFFRDAEAFQQLAPSYFPLLALGPETPILDLDHSLLRPDDVRRLDLSEGEED